MQILVVADTCSVVDIVVNIAQINDIPCVLLCDTNHVLTSDYAEVKIIGAGADAIHQSGRRYTKENIDQMLLERHLAKKVRHGSSKHHLKGLAKRTIMFMTRMRITAKKWIKLNI